MLEYASEIWCPGTPIEDLERVHLKFLKSILGFSQSTPTAAILGETGRFPLHMRQQDRALTLWIRINKLSPTDLLCKIHNELQQLARQGHDTSAERVESAIRIYTTDLPSHNTMPLNNKAIGRGWQTLPTVYSSSSMILSLLWYRGSWRWNTFLA